MLFPFNLSVPRRVYKTIPILYTWPLHAKGIFKVVKSVCQEKDRWVV